MIQPTYQGSDLTPNHTAIFSGVENKDCADRLVAQFVREKPFKAWRLELTIEVNRA